MTSTLMGSGSAAFSPADSARALAIGLRQANRRLAQVGWPVIERLALVELYADRAVDAWYGLNVLTQSAPGDFHLAPTIETGTGPLRRPLATAYRGTDADLLSVSVAGDGEIGFSMHTDRAATVVGAVTPCRAEPSADRACRFEQPPDRGIPPHAARAARDRALPGGEAHACGRHRTFKSGHQSGRGELFSEAVSGAAPHFDLIQIHPPCRRPRVDGIARACQAALENGPTG